MSPTLRRPAFTLIELMVAVIIIGLLTAAATANYTAAQRRARDNARKSQINALANAIENYYTVRRVFPGKYSTAQDGTALNAALLKNCEQAEGGYYHYYYYPLPANDSSLPAGSDRLHCDYRSAQSNGSYRYVPADYTPYPTWIPGLGSYMNPAPVEKRYRGGNGTATGDYAELLKARDTSATNYTRTFVYRRLDGGYLVATRLESYDDREISPYPTGSPAIPPSIPSAEWGTGIYLIRR
jgi:prepilin-type N-terminal cleavage/methylation domain-containing protein